MYLTTDNQETGSRYQLNAILLHWQVIQATPASEKAGAFYSHQKVAQTRTYRKTTENCLSFKASNTDALKQNNFIHNISTG